MMIIIIMMTTRMVLVILRRAEVCRLASVWITIDASFISWLT